MDIGIEKEAGIGPYLKNSACYVRGGGCGGQHTRIQHQRSEFESC